MEFEMFHNPIGAFRRKADYSYEAMHCIDRYSSINLTNFSWRNKNGYIGY